MEGATPGPSPSSDSDTDPTGPSPWTREELEGMADEASQGRTEELGAAWRSFFDGGQEDLFYYADRVFHSYMTKLATIEGTLSEIEFKNFKQEAQVRMMPAAVSAELLGMGMWRARAYAEDVIQLLVSRIEGSWREAMKRDLNLYPPAEWKGKGWDFCDNMDPDNELDGFSDGDIPDPEKGEEGYPRLFIENRLYCSRVFRKMHLEVACRQDGLQVLHLVMYPRYTYDLPLFCLDLVVAPGGRVTLAIVDACPVTKNLTLPAHYMETMQELQELFLNDPSNQRQVPEWGKAIFSPQCVCITPKDHEELEGFCMYAIALHRAHLMLAHISQPVGALADLAPTYSPATAARKRQELLEAHKRFVDQQLSNTKTARVLEAAFGVEWSNRYMRELMFDYHPEDDPPFVDSTILRMYEYFHQNPDTGGLDTAFSDARKKLDGERAEDWLERRFKGRQANSDLLGPRDPREMREAAMAAADTNAIKDKGPLSDIKGGARKRAEWAMAQLYNSDLGFQASVNDMQPLAMGMYKEGTLGGYLLDTIGDLAEAEGSRRGGRRRG